MKELGLQKWQSMLDQLSGYWCERCYLSLHGYYHASLCIFKMHWNSPESMRQNKSFCIFCPIFHHIDKKKEVIQHKLLSHLGKYLKVEILGFVVNLCLAVRLNVEVFQSIPFVHAHSSTMAEGSCCRKFFQAYGGFHDRSFCRSKKCVVISHCC